MEITIVSILTRVTVMYLLALLFVRILGKPGIGELSTMDFVVITILGDPIDNVIFSDVTIAQGAIAFATVALAHLIVSFISSRSLFIFRLVNSPPRLMIQAGRVQGEGLSAERMRPESVAFEMRLKGEDQVEEVQEAWLETNGKLSVLKKPLSRGAQKQDLKLLR